jgi:hypothetical protein
MSASRIVPILLLGLLVLAALGYGLMGKKNQTFDGVIVQDFATYEFYPNAKDCNYRGTPCVLLPDPRFQEIVVTHGDPKNLERIDRLLHGVWRGKLNGNLSHVGWFKYRKTYWREVSVNYVVDAVSLSCGDEREESH